MSDNVFTSKIEIGHKEPTYDIDFKEFDKVVRSRRSVRVFSDEKLNESLIETALDHALLAPNSSNLQSWKFYWVRSDEKLKELAKICFNQNGAKTASDLIVCVADTTICKKHCEMNLDEMRKKVGSVPKAVEHYYTKLAPNAYGFMGPFGILSPLKWLIVNITGLFSVIPREPVWPSDMKVWATKSTALACENIMLSLRAQGADSLPMEGYDGKRLSKFLKLKRGQYPVMVIACGKRSEKGIYGPQLRFDKNLFIEKL